MDQYNINSEGFNEENLKKKQKASRQNPRSLLFSLFFPFVYVLDPEFAHFTPQGCAVNV